MCHRGIVVVLSPRPSRRPSRRGCKGNRVAGGQVLWHYCHMAVALLGTAIPGAAVGAVYSGLVVVIT